MGAIVVVTRTSKVSISDAAAQGEWSFTSMVLVRQCNKDAKTVHIAAPSSDRGARSGGLVAVPIQDPGTPSPSAPTVRKCVPDGDLEAFNQAGCASSRSGAAVWHTARLGDACAVLGKWMWGRWSGVRGVR